MDRSIGFRHPARRVLVASTLFLLITVGLVAGAGYSPAPISPALRAGLATFGPFSVALIVLTTAVFVGLVAWRARWPLKIDSPSAEEPLLPPPSVPSVLGRCPVIGLIGVESGAGSSTLAFNLAVATAAGGLLPPTAARSGRPRPMCLLSEGALAESLGVSADPLVELLERSVARVPDEVVDLTKRHPSGVEMLAMAPGKVNVEQLRRLLQLLRRHYDAIVFDCPRDDAWLEEIVSQVVDVLLIVALPSDRSAGECRRWVDRLWRQRAEQRAAVVVNRRTSRRPPEGVTHGFVHRAQIPEDPAIADLDRQGLPWALDPRLAPGLEVGRLAEALVPPMFGKREPSAA